MKQLKLILFLLAIIAVAVFLILNQFVVYGIVLVGIALGIYFIWNLFIKDKDIRIAELNKKILENESRIQELEQRKFNILQITPILELGLVEIDSVLTRTVNETYNDGKLKLIGALKIDIKAKYGIDLHELKVKSEDGKILVSNLNPKFLSGQPRCSWKIDEILELVEKNRLQKTFGAEDYWRTSSKNERFMFEECEAIRKKTEMELDENGIEELKWIEKPLQQQVIAMLKVLFFTPETEVVLSDDCDETFVDIDKFLNSKLVFDNQKKLMSENN